jgi:endo-1,4-beta-xylanase
MLTLKATHFLKISNFMLKILFSKKLTSYIRKEFALVVGVFMASSIGLLLAFSHHSISAPRTSVSSFQRQDLIKYQDWSHFAGAAQQSNGIHVQGLGRKIVNQDGSGGQPNPPVNIRGPHLLVNGDFKIGAGLEGFSASNPASFYIYGAVPVIYDEWRYEPPQLRIEVTPNSLSVYRWSGKSDTFSESKSWTVNLSGQASVAVVSSKKTIFIELNGNRLGSLSGRNIFSGGNVWFGADASVGAAGWTLSSLTAEAVNNGQVQVVPGAQLKANTNNSETLRALSDTGSRHLPIGAAIADYALFGSPAYRTLAATQFNMLITENDLKPQFVHPQPNIYSFTEADSLVEFAQVNGMQIHGHTLEFSEANPRWMQVSALTDRQKIMTDHISAVVGHFNGQINSWDVVDEPLADNNKLRQNIWLKSMGESYIDKAFTAAHSANPAAKLYINEYGLEEDGSRWQAFIKLVQRLQARGVPLNGVGFQAHVYELGDEVNPSILKQHIQTLAGMGLVSRISEMDVYGDNPAHQADQYTAVLSACLSEPTCTAFATWGVSDKYGSTTNLHAYPLEYGNDLIWDAGFQPKPAYQSLQAAIKAAN